MLKFAISVGVIIGIAMWGLYFWLRRTGRLKAQEENIHELWDHAARNQGFKDFKDFARSHQKIGKTRGNNDE